MSDAYVAGVGMTNFGKFPEATIRTLAEEATAAALADAGMSPGEVEIAFFANAAAGILTGQEMIRGQVALRNTGVLGIPIVNVENACASASTAFSLACMAVAAGTVEVALAIGAEKLTHPDKSKSFAAIGAAVDMFMVEALKKSGVLGGGAADSSPGDTTAGGDSAKPKKSMFMDIYALSAKMYMEKSGATAEDFAEVAVKSHLHAADNVRAQYRTPVTREEVLASRDIAAPLTLLMCSPIGDGAAAVVVTSRDRARAAGHRLVRVRASSLVSGRDRTLSEPDAVERAAALAYEQASLGPNDVDVAEVHDAAAPAELMAYEQLGLCPPGEGPKLLQAGDTRIGGRIPVNPSGGLLAKGHPIGATGCAQIVELTEQLQGRSGSRQVHGARVALAQNGGGFLGTDPAAMVVSILSTEER